MDTQPPQKNTSSLVSLAWDLGFIFALPLVIFAIGGRMLDTRMDTSPLFLLVGIIGAAVASSVGVFYKVRTLMAATDTEKTDKKDTSEDHQV